MKLYKIFATLLAVCLMASCSDDDVVSSGVQEGLAAKISLSINVPETESVSMTRAVADAESQIGELYLIMFSQTGRVEHLNVTDYLEDDANATEKGHRTYTMDEVVTYSGTYTIYAIANWTSNFCNITTDQLDNITTASELENLLADNSSYNMQITGTNLLPMSYYVENVNITSLAENNDQAVDISLVMRRIVSHIQFTFVNGSSTDENDNSVNPNFVASSYSVYNMPNKANLIDKRHINDYDMLLSDYTDEINALNKLSSESISGLAYGKMENISTSSNTIEFFMLENVRGNGTLNETADATNTEKKYTYNDREVWDIDSPTHPRTFKNTPSPDNSTYVVVSGEYTSNNYTGSVSYIIHLGDFSEANGYDYSNFTVNRNEYHTYSCTVNGVQSIFVEVMNAQGETENKDLTPGYEGSITKADNTFVLDAHYETVMLKINKEFFYTTEGVLRDNQELRLATPKTKFEEVDYYIDSNHNGIAHSTLTETDDYKWVQFQKPDSEDAFPIYAGIDSNGDCLKVDGREWGYVDDLIENPEKYCYVSGDYYYTVAFIDEYYYDDMNLSAFVQTDNRQFIFDPSEGEKSIDGQSEIINDYGFVITQRSIKTTYELSNVESGYVPFGIETWDETGTLSWPGSVDEDDVDLLHGYNNMMTLMSSGSYNYSSASDYYADCGYLNPVTTNNREDHVWGQLSISNAIQAALARNRDLNGDGKISSDEVRWYIPGLYQYYICWLGEEYLQEDTRLFDESLFTENYETNGQPKLYTSSGDTYLIYWGDQASSISEYSDMSESGWCRNKNNIRCCRNLGDYKGTIWNPISTSNGTNGYKVINSTGIHALRSTSYTDNYGYHKEIDEMNLLPSAFEYASSVISLGSLSDGATDASTLYGYVTNSSDYTSSTNVFTFDKGWRVPNQRELMLLYMYADDVLTLTNVSEGAIVPCTTWSSIPATQKPYPFTIQRNYYSSTFRMNLLDSWGAGYAILVRDYDN